MKNRRMELSQRVRYAIIAGMAGTFLIPQVTFAAPSGGTAVFGGATIPTTSSDMNITSSNPNNVITWQDYSIANGERVQYDGGAKTNNYLNIVTGANTSNINGTIKGGNEVYIVNPNGVIFGKSAEVNVGHLYVSTQEEGTLNLSAFKATGSSHASPLVDTAPLKADVVNMGKITANTVEVHGKNIRFLNAANVHTTASPVVLHTDTANGGYAHIGYKSGNVPAVTAYQVNGANATAADNYYQLVSTKAELATINDSAATLAGNYMLANDIDLENNAHTPLGKDATDSFKGKFDGNFFRIENINVSGVDNAGLFGVLNGARIDNVGVVGGTIASNTGSGNKYAGGIAGNSTNNSALYNVYVKNTQISGKSRYNAGIIGQSADTTIDGAYSTARVGTNGGGIVGFTNGGTIVRNAYSQAVYHANNSPARVLAGSNVPPGTITIENVYTNSREISVNDTSIQGAFKNVFVASSTTGKVDKISSPTETALDPYSVTTYYDSNTNSGFSINNTGAPGAKWRIYEGRTMPLLTAFMNGRVDSVGSVGANYSYRKFNQADGSAVNDPANTATSNNHADVTGLTYDSKIVKIVDGAGNVGNTSNVTYDKTLDTTTNKIYTHEDTATPLNTTDNIRNAGTKAILWSDQDGPNLRNVNVTINKRKISVEGSNIVATRRYDGTRDVTAAFKHAITNGGIKAGGFTPEDLNDPDPSRRISITTSTDFKAMMANKHVGDGKEVTFSGKLTFAGDNKDNYDIGDFDFTTSTNTAKGKANITKAPLILKVVKDSTTKVYDGTDAVNDLTMNADPNIKLDETLHYNNETDAADIKSDETHKKDDVSINYTSIGSPTYIKSDGAAEVHAGTHKIRYKNVELQGDDKDNYELYYQKPDNTQTKVESNQIDLKGTITRRQIKTGDFKVYDKTTHTFVGATKTYDGTNEYKPTNIYLSTDKDGDTGIVDRDKTHITFALEGGKGHFLKDTNKNNTTKNVKEATHVSYTVTGVADNDTDIYGGHLLSDYYVLDADGVTKNDPGAGFDAIGKGKITPKQLTATVVKNHIEKTYDGWADQTDGNRTKTVGDPLVTLDGFVTVDGVKESRTNTSTATYASPNVAWDDATKTEKEQNVTYNVSFDRGTGEESDNYILDGTKTGDDRYKLTLTQDGSGNNYTGTIKQREVALTMGAVDKIYDGTAANKKSNVTSVAGTMGGSNDTVILSDDGITTAKLKQKHEQMMTAGTAKSSYGRGTGSSFDEDANASNGNQHDVRYQNIDELFQAVVDTAKKNNYKVDDTVYGKGTINRRLIEKSGFQVRKNDGTIADATKVYDGTSVFALKNGETLVAKTAADPTASPNTGIVDKDKDNIYFTMTGENGHFTTDEAGVNRTSHKSEANYAAYSVIAKTKNEGVSPLSNYEFGTTASKRNLENVNAENPDAVTAKGSITPAKIQAQTKEISKVYDGMVEHTDGNRNVQHGDKIVELKLIADASGQPTNTSTAAYADKNVARDTDGTIIKKAVNYTAQLTGKYVDDYEIVDAGNNVISSVNGTGDSKTVTATRNNVANMGKITPRTLNITMESVSKVYDTGSANTATNNTAVKASGTVKSITDADEPSSAVIGDILGGDGITKDDLGAAWRALRDHGDAVSDYGHKGNTPFEDENASAAPEGHDVRYTNMDTAFKNQYGMPTAGNYTVASDAYGKGTITPKALDPNKFNVENESGVAVPASKSYDGTSGLTVKDGWKIRPSTGSGTGLFSRDANRVKFKLSQKGAYFIDKNGNKTAHASNKGTAAETDMDAVKASYHVIASADPGYEKLLKNYTLNGKTLDSGEASVTGVGHIERRELSLDLVQKTGIDREYDGQTTLTDTNAKHWNALTDNDSAGNVQYAAGATASNKLVTTDGTSFKITSNYMNDASTPTPDKNVKRSGGVVVDKNIQYNISIAGGDARNYAFKKGGAVSNAEDGLKLSATGKIKPKDLSGAFAPIPDKVYDGTDHVDATKVQFTTGALIAGDDVQLATHSERYQSKNVNGDGTTWKTPGGTEQKNWVNYSNLSLSGADAKNYQFGSDVRGIGRITPYKINPNTNFNVTFDGRLIAKTYNGTDEADRSHIASVSFTGVPGETFTHEVKTARYDNGGHRGGRDQHDVMYTLAIRPGTGVDLANYDLSDLGTLGSDRTFTRTNTTDGRIYARPVYVKVNGTPTKTYDGSEELMNRATDGDGNVIRTADQLVTLSTGTKDTGSGLLGTDGTRNASTAVYTDRNVMRNAGSVADRPNGVKYTLALVGGDVTDYEFTTASGYATVNTVGTAKDTMGAGRINPRKLTLDIAHVSKEYDQTSVNNPTTNKGPIGATVQADNTDGRAQDALNAGGLASFDFSNTVTSDFVATEDSPAENVRRDKDGNVIDKPVVYRNIRAELGARLTAVGNTIDNYEVEDTAHGKGKITPYQLTSGNVKIRVIKVAEKKYDGDNIVRYQGSDKPEDVRNNLSATVKINGVDVPILDGVVAKATYDNNPRGNVKNEQPQKVTYQLSYRAGNIELPEGTVLTPENQGYGIIKRRDLTKYVPPHLAKEYDGKGDVVYDTSKTDRDIAEKDRPYIDAIRKHSLTSVIEKDKGVVNLTVTGTFDKNATTDTLQEAQTGTSGRHTVNYTLKLTGSDAEILDNYTIGGHPVQGTATGTIDISRRTLTIDVDPVSKQYDGTSRVAGLTKDKLHLSGFVPGDVVEANQKFDDNAVDQIKGVYMDSRGNPSADVERYKGQYAKAVKYTNLNNALKDMARRDPNSWARNYRLDDKAYTIDQAKGAITPREIRADQVEISRFAPVAKEYDGTRLVKNGQPLPPHAYIKDEHGNYLVNDDGSRLDIRGNLKVDWDEHRTHYEDPNVTVGRPSQDVTYGMNYVGSENFNISGTLQGRGEGDITRRKLVVKTDRFMPTKVYDTNRTILGVAYDQRQGGRRIITQDDLDKLAQFKHYGDNADGIVDAHTTHHVDAEFTDPNVAWSAEKPGSDPHAMWQDRHDVELQNVKYAYTLSGAGASNYELVDDQGNTIKDVFGNLKYDGSVLGKGKILPYTITMQADRVELRSNEPMPSTFTGVVKDGERVLERESNGYRVHGTGEDLKGTFAFAPIVGEKRWGAHLIKGRYIPRMGEVVYRNYYFAQDPANVSALYLGPYAPEREYYNELTQMSKMLPDEYAYENASLDRRSHFGRDAEAEVTYIPPSINMVRDGMDLSKSDLFVTDKAVFAIVSEVFG